MSCREVRKHLKKPGTDSRELYTKNGKLVKTKQISNTVWTVAMTVAYRRQPTVRESLLSLKQAGWHSALLFSEPDANHLPPNSEESSIFLAEDKLGAWPNFCRMIKCLSETVKTDKVLIVQDDIQIKRKYRHWLENNWPTSEGIVSLYRSSRYQVLNPESDWEILDFGKPFLGSLAVAMSLDHLKSLALNLEAFTDGNDRQVDIKLGKFATGLKIPLFIPVKSGVQHTGDTSSIYARATNSGARRANTYEEE